MVAMYWRKNWAEDWNLPEDVNALEWNDVIASYQPKCRRTPIGVASENSIHRFIRKITPLRYVPMFKSREEPIEDLKAEISNGIPNILVYDHDVFLGRSRYADITRQPASETGTIGTAHAVVASRVTEELIHVYDPHDFDRKNTTPRARETFLAAWRATNYRCGVPLPVKAKKAFKKKPSRTLLDFTIRRRKND